MPRILIAYDTTEGQTRKIAQFMGDAVRRAGRDVQVVDIRRPPSGFALDGFDAVLVGASIHLGKHSGRLLKFVRRHQVRLKAVPSAFFSVSLSAAGSDKEKNDARRFVEELLRQSEWSPAVKAAFAGGLMYREYGLLKRWMMKKIAKGGGKDTDTSKNHEYTDWTAVERFVGEFLAGLEPCHAEEQHPTA